MVKWKKSAINTTASNSATVNMTPINITSSNSVVGTAATTSSQGGTVYITPGTYTIGSPWTIAPNWVITTGSGGNYNSINSIVFDYKVPGTTIPWTRTKTLYVVKKELTLGLYDFMMLMHYKAKGEVVEED